MISRVNLIYYSLWDSLIQNIGKHLSFAKYSMYILNILLNILKYSMHMVYIALYLQMYNIVQHGLGFYQHKYSDHTKYV